MRARMLKLSLWLFPFVGASLVASGLIYISRSEFMPYHSAALGRDWSDLLPNEQGVMLAALRGGGGGL